MKGNKASNEKDITIDQEYFNENAQELVEAMLRGILTFDPSNELLNEDKTRYEYIGETLVGNDESDYSGAVDWMQAWVKPGFDEWFKGYGGAETKAELEDFRSEAENDYAEEAGNVIENTLGELPLAKQLKASFYFSSSEWGDYGLFVALDAADFKKAKKAFMKMNLANGKPVFVNESKKGLKEAKYQKATDDLVRCATCMWYRGYAQLCGRFWVSVNPDFICDKYVRFPGAGELKVAKANAGVRILDEEAMRLGRGSYPDLVKQIEKKKPGGVKKAAATREYKCFYTGEVIPIAELIAVDKLMESLQKRVGKENYKEFLDALQAMRKNPRIPSKGPPYVHKFKGTGDYVVNVCKKIYNKALALYQSNDAKNDAKPKGMRETTYDKILGMIIEQIKKWQPNPKKSAQEGRIVAIQQYMKQNGLRLDQIEVHASSDVDFLERKKPRNPPAAEQRALGKRVGSTSGGKWTLYALYVVPTEAAIKKIPMRKSTIDITDETEPNEGDYIINNKSELWEFDHAGGTFLGKIGEGKDFEEYEDAYKFIKNRMDQNKFWTNVWNAGERGDISMDKDWQAFLKKRNKAGKTNKSHPTKPHGTHGMQLYLTANETGDNSAWIGEVTDDGDVRFTIIQEMPPSVTETGKPEYEVSEIEVEASVATDLEDQNVKQVISELSDMDNKTWLALDPERRAYLLASGNPFGPEKYMSSDSRRYKSLKTALSEEGLIEYKDDMAF